MNPVTLKLVAVLVILSAAFGGGWYVRGEVEAVEDAKQAAAMQRAVDAFRGHEQQIAQTLEAKLAQLKANQTVIEREIPKIIDRPVYRNVCLDDDGLRVLENARTGKASSSKPAAEMPAVSQ